MTGRRLGKFPNLQFGQAFMCKLGKPFASSWAGIGGDVLPTNTVIERDESTSDHRVAASILNIGVEMVI